MIGAAVLLGLAALLPVAAHASGAQAEPARNLIRDVILPALESMDRTVRDSSGVALTDRGYESVPGALSPRTRRELRRLQVDHDCRIAELEIDLQERIDKAQAEFEEDVAREHRQRKRAEKRDRLAEKVGEAYAKFEEKVAGADESFREKRRKILRKARD